MAHQPMPGGLRPSKVIEGPPNSGQQYGGYLSSSSRPPASVFPPIAPGKQSAGIESMTRVVSLIKESGSVEATKAQQETRISQLWVQARSLGITDFQMRESLVGNSKISMISKTGLPRITNRVEAVNRPITKRERLERLNRQIVAVQRRLERVPSEVDGNERLHLLDYQLKAERERHIYLERRLQLLQQVVGQVADPQRSASVNRKEVFDLIKQNNGTSSTKTFTWNNQTANEDSKTVFHRGGRGENAGSSLPNIRLPGRRGLTGSFDNTLNGSPSGLQDSNLPGDLFENMRVDSATSTSVKTKLGKIERLNSIDPSQLKTNKSNMSKDRLDTKNVHITAKKFRLSKQLAKIADSSGVQPLQRNTRIGYTPLGNPRQHTNNDSRRVKSHTTSIEKPTSDAKHQHILGQDQPIINSQNRELPAKPVVVVEQASTKQEDSTQGLTVPAVGFFRKSLFGVPEMSAGNSFKDSGKKTPEQVDTPSLGSKKNRTSELLAMIPSMVKRHEVNEQIEIPKAENRKSPLLVLITEQLFKDIGKQGQPGPKLQQGGISKPGENVQSTSKPNAPNIVAVGTTKAFTEAGNLREKNTHQRPVIGDSFWKQALGAAVEPKQAVEQKPAVEALFGSNRLDLRDPGDARVGGVNQDGQGVTSPSKSGENGKFGANDSGTIGRFGVESKSSPKHVKEEWKDGGKLGETENWVGIGSQTKLQLQHLWEEDSGSGSSEDDGSEDSRSRVGGGDRISRRQDRSPARHNRHAPDNWFTGETSRSYLNQSSVRFE